MIIPEQEYHPSPKDMAKEFCEMWGSEQAEFIAEVLRIFDSWSASNASYQMHSIMCRFREHMKDERVSFRFEDLKEYMAEVTRTHEDG